MKLIMLSLFFSCKIQPEESGSSPHKKTHRSTIIHIVVYSKISTGSHNKEIQKCINIFYKILLNLTTRPTNQRNVFLIESSNDLDQMWLLGIPFQLDHSAICSCFAHGVPSPSKYSKRTKLSTQIFVQLPSKTG